jgi:hypothetical protein
MSKKEKHGFQRFFLFPFFSLLFAIDESCQLLAGTFPKEIFRLIENNDD